MFVFSSPYLVQIEIMRSSDSVPAGLGIFTVLAVIGFVSPQCSADEPAHQRAATSNDSSAAGSVARESPANVVDKDSQEWLETPHGFRVRSAHPRVLVTPQHLHIALKRMAGPAAREPYKGWLDKLRAAADAGKDVDLVSLALLYRATRDTSYRDKFMARLPVKGTPQREELFGIDLLFDELSDTRKLAVMKRAASDPNGAAPSASTSDSGALGPFVHIPGPNPILTSGGPGDWDEAIIEAGDALKDGDTYYLYYHGVAKTTKRWGKMGYRIGLATAKHPLGPWTKYGDQPLLGLGPEGTWEDRAVACAFILRDAPGKYYMWYSGCGTPKKRGYSVGLATAPRPEGPWTKHPQNPLIESFGYVGGVVKHQGKYFLYTEHPIASISPDYGPISLAMADAPEGPWKIWPSNPVLGAAEKGGWDDGGYSEAEVTFFNGRFHLFYGGAKAYPQRFLTRESIGYAYSRDGLRFTKYAANPVARREVCPNMGAFAEVHTLIEPPFVYAYHTVRYLDETRVPGRNRKQIEDLGVQVLAFQRPFRLTMPVLARKSLAAGAATNLDDCAPIALENTSTVNLIAEAAYALKAAAPTRGYVRSSIDGMNYDPAESSRFDIDLRPGQLARKTIDLDLKVKFIKVIIENPDRKASLSDVRVSVTIGG